MALVTTITPTEIAVALGRTAPASNSPTEQQWQMWITDALMLVQARATELDIDDADVGQISLDYVIREAVVAQVRRPDDATQVATSVDDASVSKTYRSGSGRVKILDEWWALLGMAPKGGQAFSVDTAASGVVHQPWCSLLLGATYCSCGADLAGFPLWEY